MIPVTATQYLSEYSSDLEALMTPTSAAAKRTSIITTLASKPTNPRKSAETDRDLFLGHTSNFGVFDFASNDVYECGPNH